MKLFTVGPVQMDKKILDASNEGIPYFRNQQFSNKMLEIQDMLLNVFNAPKGYKSVILTCSGTGGLESAVCSIPDNRKVLIINGGTFGKRFTELCEVHNVEYDEIKVDIDQDLTKEDLEKYKGKGYFALLCNIHETSIGKLYDKKLISEFCKSEGCYMIIDAISSAFADEYDLSEFNADITILSSQKALSLAPGLSILLLSKRYIDEVISTSKCKCFYLDIKDHLKNMERGQTPFTPALHEIEQLQIRLKNICSYSDEVENVKKLAQYFRKEVKSLGFGIPTFSLSNCLTPIICPKNNAKEILNKLVEKGLYVNPCGGNMADKMLRIGHIGHLNQQDFDVLIEELRRI